MPANCNLEVKQVNPEIWNNVIGSKERSTDIQIQKSQKLISKASYAILKIADSAINANKSKKDRKKSLKAIIKNATDALAFMTTSQIHSETLRRELILKKLAPEQRSIGKNVPPDDKLLFGDNLNKKLTEAAGMQKLKPRKFRTSSSHTITSKSRYQGGSFSGYPKNGYKPRKSSSRGQKGGFKYQEKKKDN